MTAISHRDAGRPHRPAARRGRSAACAACRTAASPGCSSRRRSLLLLAINIFPLIWTIRLSFTNYSPTAELPTRFVGIDNYVDILTDDDIWARDAGDGAFRVLDDRAADR